MRPYYENSDTGITIYHGDCREVLPTLRGIGLVLTDPPYGMGFEAPHCVTGAFADDFLIGIDGVNMAPGARLAAFMSPRRVIAFAAGLTTWNFERMLWLRKEGDIAHPWRGWHMNSEAIVVASRTHVGWPIAHSTRSDCYAVGFSGGKNGHPAAKPISVVRDLCLRLAGANDVVLDPFMGSGTTLRAALDLGRRAVGIEIEERYCEIAARRLRQMVLPLALATGD